MEERVLKAPDNDFNHLAYYPPPSCDDVDEGVFMPTENCGQLYYICIQGEIIFQVNVIVINRIKKTKQRCSCPYNLKVYYIDQLHRR